ncbi:hypothetical protein M595_2794 [Lyngbya aestuarii BL J]|uniref:Uncharacterized protein n=1 Tax=Lyngbya aestuarii BL J TaxID=1348334 RepID=U7QLG2_9CYAN|nr:hypothetical protein M595_2794 [Lyngbya aestuarii BL J]
MFTSLYQLLSYFCVGYDLSLNDKIKRLGTFISNNIWVMCRG